MAGFEIEPNVLRGTPIRNAITGWFISAALAFAAALLLFKVRLAADPTLTALSLSTTAIGALMPILRDSRLLVAPYGAMVLAGGAIGEAAPVIVLSLVLAKGRTPLQSGVMLAFAVGAFAAVLFAARAREGYFAGIVERTMASSGQLPMRLAICVLILLIELSRQLEIDMALAALVAGAIARPWSRSTATTSQCGWTESVQHFWSQSSSSRRESAWTSRLCSQIRWPCPWCRSIRY